MSRVDSVLSKLIQVIDDYNNPISFRWRSARSKLFASSLNSSLKYFKNNRIYNVEKYNGHLYIIFIQLAYIDEWYHSEPREHSRLCEALKPVFREMLSIFADPALFTLLVKQIPSRFTDVTTSLITRHPDIVFTPKLELSKFIFSQFYSRENPINFNNDGLWDSILCLSGSTWAVFCETKPSATSDKVRYYDTCRSILNNLLIDYKKTKANDTRYAKLTELLLCIHHIKHNLESPEKYTVFITSILKNLRSDNNFLQLFFGTNNLEIKEAIDTLCELTEATDSHIRELNALRKIEYRWIKELGRGSFGRVYLFKNAEDGNVAVKLALKDGERYLKNEYNLLSQFDHPNIIGINPASNPERLILEYATHGTLRPFCERNITDDTTRRSLAGDMAAGLAYLHEEQSTIHGDIADSNVGLFFNDRRLTARWIDFGNAIHFTDTMQVKPIRCGHFEFMATEIARMILEALDANHKHPFITGLSFDKAKNAERYSFGLVLLFLATHLTAYDTPACKKLTKAQIADDRLLSRAIATSITKEEPLQDGGGIFHHQVKALCSKSSSSRPPLSEVARQLRS